MIKFGDCTLKDPADRAVLHEVAHFLSNLLDFLRGWAPAKKQVERSSLGSESMSRINKHKHTHTRCSIVSYLESPVFQSSCEYPYFDIVICWGTFKRFVSTVIHELGWGVGARSAQMPRTSLSCSSLSLSSWLLSLTSRQLVTSPGGNEACHQNTWGVECWKKKKKAKSCFLFNIVHCLTVFRASVCTVETR